MTRAALAVAAATMASLGFIGTPVHAATSSGCGGTHWVGAWAAAPAHAAFPGFAEQSLRMIVHPHYGGDSVRLRLTNRFGSQPVTFGAVTVGKRAADAAVEPGSNRQVSFGGRSSVTLPPHTEMLSDPVGLRVEAFTDLAVSIYVRGAAAHATKHPLAMQTSYYTPLGSGDHTGSDDGSAFTKETGSWYFLAGVDVAAPRGVGAVVALGDSITDGKVSTGGTVLQDDPAAIGVNGRYPDVLARRLAARPGPSRMSVLNAGISSNRVASDGLLPDMGPSAVSRLDADVLAQSGVTDVIVMEGTNDLGMTLLPSARDVIDGLDHIVRRLRASGMNVLLGTIPPAGGALVPHGTPFANAARVEVNTWIRTRPYGVELVDFDRALRDPTRTSRLRPDYDSGDQLHPSMAGYRAMASTVDLASLRGNSCTADERTT